MKVVSNTSPLVAFSALERLDILKAIFTKLIIPRGVYEELSYGDKKFQIESWIDLKEIKDKELYKSLRLKLDYGESEAIACCIENNYNYCLLDDKQARKLARGLKVNVMGTIGILLIAKNKKLT